MNSGSIPLTDITFSQIKETIQKQGKRLGVRNLLIFYIGIYCGYRINEIITLDLESVAKYYPKINDRIFIPARKMKGKFASRSVFIHPNLKKYIKDYLDQYEEIYKISDYKKKTYSESITEGPKLNNLRNPLFPSSVIKKNIENGGYVFEPIKTRAIIKLYTDVGRELKIEKFSSHSCRKFYAKNMFEALGGNLVDVSAGLGHATLNSTCHYLKFKTNERVDNAINKFSFEEREECLPEDKPENKPKRKYTKKIKKTESPVEIPLVEEKLENGELKKI